jgi:hypothetical protein
MEQLSKTIIRMAILRAENRTWLLKMKHSVCTLCTASNLITTFIIHKDLGVDWRIILEWILRK